MCGKEKGEGSLKDILLSDDPLCSECRDLWKRKKIRLKIKGIPAEAFYVYNKAFSEALIQYKECGDEALRDIFLYPVKKEISRKYRGYTFLLMPSTEEKREQRGFDHLEEMLKGLHVRTASPFYKIRDISQKKSGKTARKQMESDIAVREGYRWDQKIVLFDDVITTGSTIRGALSCIDDPNVKIRILAAAANQRLLAEDRKRKILRSG